MYHDNACTKASISVICRLCNYLIAVSQEKLRSCTKYFQEKIYFSAEIGKAAEVRTNEWGQTERKIYDRATKKRYVITDENVCDVTDLYESIQKMCMPPSAVFIGSTVLDNNNLTVNNYYVNKSHENSFIDINLMTIPIKEGVCIVVKSVIKFQNVTLTST